MSLAVSQREVGNCRVEFEIEAPVDVVDGEYVSVTQDYRRRARIDGFRKGKAPLAVVRQRFAEAIAEDVSERLVPKMWEEVRDERGVRPMVQPQVELIEVAPGRPLRFKVTVDVEPEVELGDDRSFELPETDTEPTEAEVDDLLERVRQRFSTWSTAERSASRGDRVRGRIHRSAVAGFDPDEAEEDDPRGPATHDVDFELGDEQIWPELTDNATGLGAGGSVTFERMERDGDIERRREYELQVEEILERILPEVNDEWAGGLAPSIDSVDDLRQNLREQATIEKVASAKRQRTDAMLEQLRARYPVVLPEGAIDREALRMTRQYALEMERRGVDPKELPWADLTADIRERAVRRAHEAFLLDLIARADGIEPTPQEVDDALRKLAQSENTSPARVRREMEREGGMLALRADLRRDRTLNILLEANAPQTEPAASEGTAAQTAEGED